MSGTQPPAALERRLLLGFHALLSGSFLVAWLSGNEDSYVMHQVAGYLAAAAIGLRLLVVPLARSGSLLRLPRPRGAATLAWLRRLMLGDAAARRERSPLHAWLALALFAGVGLAAASGILADSWPRLDDVHDALSDLALWIVLAHVAAVFGLHALKPRLAAPVRQVALPVLGGILAAGLGASAVLAASSPARQVILAGYAAEARRAEPGFAGFSAARGQALYLGPHAGGRAETPACATCHTPDPTREGKHQRTGRAIPPMAVAADPRRFTDAAEVEKRFARDCQAVLGRACTAREKGDFITFLESR